MKCDVCKTEYAAVKSVDITAPQVQPLPPFPVNPFGVDNYGRPFKSQAEADDYFAADAAREINIGGGLDARQQAALQPGQIDLKALDRAQLEDVLYKLGHGESQFVFRNFGPTKSLHPLSAFMMASGITDAGYMKDGVSSGLVVPPDGWPELGDMTVARAKELAGL
jgi:hypothetical protein